MGACNYLLNGSMKKWRAQVSKCTARRTFLLGGEGNYLIRICWAGDMISGQEEDQGQ